MISIFCARGEEWAQEGGGLLSLLSACVALPFLLPSLHGKDLTQTSTVCGIKHDFLGRKQELQEIMEVEHGVTSISPWPTLSPGQGVDDWDQFG